MNLKVKVDTGAEANILPHRNIEEMGIPAKLLIFNRTTLTAYNGTDIPQRGIIKLETRHKDGKWQREAFFVAETKRLAILGLPSCRALSVVSLNSVIQTAPKKVNNMEELIKQYPKQFDKIGHFADATT